MSKPRNGSPLLPQRAFVVQFRKDADVVAGRWAGRVEHVTSGRASHFQSWEQLVAFVTAVLASPAATGSDE